MNRKTRGLKIVTEGFILSIKKADSLIQQTQEKPQEKLEITLTISRVSFPFDVPLHLEDEGWM